MPKLKDVADAVAPDEPMIGHWTDGLKIEPFDATMPLTEGADPASPSAEPHWTDGLKIEPFDAPWDNSIAFDDAYWDELFRLESLVTEEEGARLAAALNEQKRVQKELMRREMGLPE